MAIAKYNDKNLPAGKDAALSFYEWARKAAKEHGAASTISTYDKSASNKSYVLQYFGTWGEVLTAARANALAEKVTEKEIKAVDYKVQNPEEYAKKQAAAEAKKKADEAAAKKAAEEKAAYEKANRKSTDKDFISWIKTQYHNPEDEISNFNKLTLKYTVPSGIKTWGDWYKYAGLETAPVKPVEKPAAPKPKTEYEKNLEAMGAAYQADRTTPEQQAAADERSRAMSMDYFIKILDKEKPGSQKYNDALAGLKKVSAESAAAFEEKKKTETAVTTKEKASQRQKLVDALQRAKDYGTPEQRKKAQDALNDFDGKNPTVAKDAGKDNAPEVRYGPNGESLVPGTPAYEKGSTVKPGATGGNTGGATGGNTGGNTGGATGGNTGGNTGGSSGGTQTPPAMGPGSDPKGVWISALKQTFKTGIDDPKQKKQIDDLIAKAKQEKWNEATFMEAMKNTSWWQATFPTLRQFFLDSHDPRNAATFAQTMVNKYDSVVANMDLLGIKVNDIDPVTGKVIDNREIIKGIAAQALQNGWDDNQIKQHLATKSEIIFTGGGQLGGYLDQIKRQALNYGISLDANQLSTINHDLLNPMDGKDAQWYLNNIKQQAIDANPAFASSLKEGRTLYDVTSSYRKTMSDLLEVDPTNITWNDLMSKVMNKDKGVAYTLSDFTKQVKQDPLWQKTKNAKETYSNMALDLMKQFGFMG